jgi:hypothetical protein
MDKFKKNKLFYSALILLGALFATGCAFAVLDYLAKSKSSLVFTRTHADADRLLKGHALAPGAAPVSLTAENVKKAEEDLAELTKHIELLKASIRGNAEVTIVGKASPSASELTSQLKQSVDEWRKLAKDQDIKTPASEQCDFGFRRYIRNPGTSPKRDLQHVDQQRLIIDFLFRQLVESRPQGAPLLFESIDREPVETFVLIPEGKPGAGTYGPEADGTRNEPDEFVPTRTFDRRGLVETLSFRVRFVGYTPTLRTFVNKVRNSGRPLAVTSVEVGPTSRENEKLLTAVPVVTASATPAAVAPAAGGLPAGLASTFFSGDAASGASTGATGTPGAPQRDDRPVVVREAPSAFVVQIDYLSLPEPKAPAPEGEPKK